MGLDMYLRASKYVSGYSFRGEEESKVYARLVEMFDVQEYVDPDTPSGNVEFTVAYWRKANHIHQWFVDNVQGGEDECKPHYVSREQLRELREVCLRVLWLPTKSRTVEGNVIREGRISVEKRKVGLLTEAAQREAADLLPTQSGFFFGGTEYDHWYLEDVKRTVEQLDRALSMPDDWSFEYQSSW
jgi:hypothetical protein